MAKAFQMKLDSIQPTQLYISSAKLDTIMRRFEQSKPVLVEPIPVKILGNQVIFVNGHTRALAAFLLGLLEIPVCWEDEQLDWNEYEVCLKWCREEGIYNISDLRSRIVSQRLPSFVVGQMQKDATGSRGKKKSSEELREYILT
jgi:hypothetical protein